MVQLQAACGAETPVRRGQIKLAHLEHGVVGENAQTFLAHGGQGRFALFLFGQRLGGNRLPAFFQRVQTVGVQVFCGNVNIERAVCIRAVMEFVETELAFGVNEALGRLAGFGVVLHIFHHDFVGRYRAVGIDERANLQIADHVNQLVDFQIVINLVFPHEFGTRQLGLRRTQRDLRIAGGIAFADQLPVFQLQAAFVGQHGFEQRGFEFGRVMRERVGIFHLPAQTAPIQLDAGQLFIFERGNLYFHSAAAVQRNHVADTQRFLFAEEARQRFLHFVVIHKFGFHHRAHGFDTVGERMVVHVVNHGDGFGQHGAQIVGQLFAQIAQHLRMEAQNGFFGRFQPALFVFVRYDFKQEGFRQNAVLDFQTLLGLGAQIMRGANAGGRHQNGSRAAQ